jgi:hypothetical protein
MRSIRRLARACNTRGHTAGDARDGGARARATRRRRDARGRRREDREAGNRRGGSDGGWERRARPRARERGGRPARWNPSVRPPAGRNSRRRGLSRGRTVAAAAFLFAFGFPADAFPERTSYTVGIELMHLNSFSL